MAISIKEPCNEDWSKMTATQRGAFCQRCAIDVLDFTDKTSFEIKALLVQELEKGGRTCGRITNVQLAQLNGNVLQFKNQQEAFRAVWMFSLVCVFGLSLFSCQNTMSKEMIEQMRYETTTIIQDDSLLTDAEKENDWLLNDNSDLETKPPKDLPSVTDQWPVEVTYQGMMPMQEIFNEGITCGIDWLDTLIIFGAWYVDPADKPALKASLPIIDNFPPHSMLTPTSEREPAPQNPISQRIDAIANEEVKEFNAFISPNPITPESFLYLRANIDLDMELSINNSRNNALIKSAKKSFEQGEHIVDMNLKDFHPGSMN